MRYENERLGVRFVAIDGQYPSIYEPKYATQDDACRDLKAYVPEGKVTIPAGQTKVISAGIKVALPEDSVMMMFVRSSIGIKKHLCLANGTGIIDRGYRDEILMALHNFGDEPVEIVAGDRVCQFLVFKRPYIELWQVEDDEKFRENDRGGGIGSTGN